jgi:hypothetical protein
MSNRRKPRAERTDDERFVKCPDCASTVRTVHQPGAVMNIEVEHSPSCPAWRSPAREVALTFLPPAPDDLAGVEQ